MSSVYGRYDVGDGIVKQDDSREVTIREQIVSDTKCDTFVILMRKQRNNHKGVSVLSVVKSRKISIQKNLSIGEENFVLHS